ncbi:polyphosphate kinase 1 [Microcoleus sp. FACHB-1515]|uniref:polyphosphate kinase 1 n=1 Tax=Cyanophyceae TaxID=3028117 RepID=UPI0016875889|nr:polyphosphate kinase 1 [Microcoleus sp. FACHB-1515]MBD2088414.1 polyphosphate kinase 1 [Microcoleus sp. FACHB-1515]
MSPKDKSIALNDPQYYFNRELSWLEFNQRVLHEAIDSRTPLLERLKFAAIFSSNLDEFFMVRVALLKQRLRAGIDRFPPDGLSPQAQLEAIAQRLRPMVAEQHRHFQTLRPQLIEHGVYLLDYADLNEVQQRSLQDYFERRIYPVLTPLAVDPGHPFPQMSNLSLNLAVVVRDPATGKSHFARVKVPSSLPRFISLSDFQPKEKRSIVWAGVPIEQVIAHNLKLLFKGMAIESYSLFRVTRDMYMELEEDEAGDLLSAIQQELRTVRLAGSVIRLEVQSTMPKKARQTLTEELELTEQDLYEIEGLLNLRDLMSLLSLPLPDLKDPPWSPVIPARLRSLDEYYSLYDSPTLGDGEDFFSMIRSGDLLVHHPYESFNASVERFIAEAAHDPKVLTIKMTLYRTSGDPIVNALIAAANNGKQVVALVELKARFDEENNIAWAQLLEKAGVHVVYGLVGLKTHTKIILIVRQEGEELRRYVHIGTGNYNPKTAQLYTDLGIISCRDDLGADLTDLFNHLTGYTRQDSYRKLLVAPVNLRDRMIAMLRREADQHVKTGSGYVIAKMNALVDPLIIKTLYETSQAGVKIDLIVRGICCLKPGIKGVSENIRVISIIGRFLEHSRIFYFHNGGAEEFYIGSADWMPRNLDRRVEAITPIEDPTVAQRLKEILDVMLADNRHAWELQPDGSYKQRHPAKDELDRAAQTLLMEAALRSSNQPQ